ncbi:polysaccharide lyase family 11 protein [Parathielavia hyrcaniae]|uniref:Polysaccharide lyase family 11 protein n=1 Tax=Parathielavia hyrcaniae TaxID=113614 RepID=A0AAN6SX97_9PEZI|nr:polysaccharide lyase family 11 protein [Parathielavia hyrcaniae]
MRFSGILGTAIAAAACLAPLASAQRPMERLGRGVVAVRSSARDVFVSWRLLGLDPDNIAFNLYRAANSGAPVKLNGSPLTGGTNFVDSTANLAQPNTYSVHPVINGQEEAAGGAFTLPANEATEPVVRVPLQGGGTGPIKFVWVGDLDGDGEYDYVLDRQTSPQLLEAYRNDSTFLWRVNMGPNSQQQNNISPGSSANNLGHNDGVTVYDFDSDGYAEVAVRIANGVTFGNGQRFTHSNDNEQFIAILDGRTGALRARAQIPTVYIGDGPLAARFGVGYLDGQRPSLVAYLKNRQSNGAFNLLMAAWNFDGSSLTQQWKWRRDNQDAPDGHNTRIIDVDGDGRDEIHEIGFTLNGDGRVRYLLGPQGIVHGDRFHIAKMDPTRLGLQGFAVQQGNPSGLLEYYYDATRGTIIWRHQGAPGDVGRGMVGDIDPTRPGMESWSFFGLYNAPSNQLLVSDTSNAPWPHLGLFWDGDILMELYNDGKTEKWSWEVPVGERRSPQAEVILVGPNNDELVIFTTDRPTSIRLYTLAHNPAYRNSMTLKGYVQSHHVDYFIGQDMAKPPRPNIRYVGSSSPSPTPTPTTTTSLRWRWLDGADSLRSTMDMPAPE